MNDKQNSVDENIKIRIDRDQIIVLRKFNEISQERLNILGFIQLNKKGFYNGQMDFCNFCRFEHLDSRKCFSLLEHQIEIIFPKFVHKFIFSHIA